MTDEKELDKELRNLEFLKKIVIDSSTAIRLEEFDLLSMVTQLLKVYVLPSVLEETGPDFFHNTNALLISSKDIQMYQFTVSTRSTDEQLIGYGKEFGCPIATEDRKILQKGESHGISMYPFGLLLLLIIMKGNISISHGREIWNDFNAKYSYQKNFKEFCQDLLNHLERSR